MRAEGKNRIKRFYSTLSLFLKSGNIATRCACVKTFRCIANGGIDPTMLKDDIPQASPKENSAQVVDTIFIQDLLRESGVVQVAAGELFGAFNDYSCRADEMRELVAKNMQRETTAKRKQRGPSSGQVSDANEVGMSDDASGMLSMSDLGDLITDEQLQAGALEALELAKLLLDLCLDLSVDPRSAALMCHNGYLCDAMVLSLGEEAKATRPDQGHISKSIELMWNCLESYVVEMKAASPEGTVTGGSEVINFGKAIVPLRGIFKSLLFTGYRQSDKEIRNEIAIIFTLLAQFPASVPHFIKSGLLNDILTFASVGEAGPNGWSFYSIPLPKLRNFSTVTEIDLQLKRELWMLIGDLLMSNDPDVITAVASSPFMSVLFMYIEQNSMDRPDSIDRNDTQSPDGTLLGHILGDDLDCVSTGSNTEGTLHKPRKLQTVVDSIPVGQLREIQVLAMSILAAHAHRMMGEYLRINGPTRALAVLSYSSSQIPEHKSFVYHTFLLLNRGLMDSNVVNKRLEELKAIRIFLHFFESSDDFSSRAQSARMITVLCKSTECQKQLREMNGIGPLVAALNQLNGRKAPMVGKVAGVEITSYGDGENDTPSSTEEGGEMNVFAISVLACIWEAVVKNGPSEEVFAEQEGVDALFDMLEVSTFITRSMILRLLSDLFDNRRLVPFAYAWRSHKTMRSVGQLLAHCWMDEEVRIGCVRGPDGVVCNIWDGLGNHEWPVVSTDHILSESSEFGSLQADYKSSTVSKLNTAILEARQGSSSHIQKQVRSKALQSDLRGVIAAIFQSLGFLELPVVDSIVEPLEDSFVKDEMAMDAPDKGKKSVQRSFLRSLSSMVDGNPVAISKSEIADQSLTPSERQVISVAMRYDTLREGEWWKLIRSDLEAANVIPVDADANLLEDVQERVFAATRAIQFEQMELSLVSKQDKQSREDIFFNHIILQKNQQIKSEYLKRKSGRRVSTM